MTGPGFHPSPPDVHLREAVQEDLPILFEYQRDPIANRMAAFPARDREAFFPHWTKILCEPGVIIRIIECEGVVVGNLSSFEKHGLHLIGYWLGREHWGKGIASRAIAQFLAIEVYRPLHAYVAKHNAGSIRVLEKCGFTVCGESEGPGETAGEVVEDFIYVLR